MKNDNDFTEDFLLKRAKNIKDLKKKLGQIDFFQPSKYKNPWRGKYFDDFNNLNDLQDYLNKTKSKIVKRTEKDNFIEKNSIFENLIFDKDSKEKKIRNIDYINDLNKKKDIFFELGSNKNFLNKKVIKKIDNGLIEIDHKIDLHLLKLSEAFDYFISEIIYAYKNHKRLVLVITGKGFGSGKILKECNNFFHTDKDSRCFEDFNDKEIIRNNILDWVNGNKILINICLYINFASKKHGGNGAFYIYLK
jgi:DNA-nicking Smr family endonuclease